MERSVAYGPVLYFVSGQHKQRFVKAICDAGRPEDSRLSAFLFLATINSTVWSVVSPAVNLPLRSILHCPELDEHLTAYEKETIRLAYDLYDGSGYCRVNTLVEWVKSPVWFEAVLSALRLASPTFDHGLLACSMESFE